MSDHPSSEPSSTPEHPTGSGQPSAPTPAPDSAEASSEATLAADPLTQAQAEVAILQAKVTELQDQYIRGQAEVQHSRRRADEDVS